MSNTLSYRSIKHRAVTIVVILLAAIALVLFTGCAPASINEPAPPTISLDDVDPKDDHQVQLWIDYYLEIDEIEQDELQVMEQAVDQMTKWAMSPQDCRSRIATSIVDEAARQDIEEDDEKVTFAILVATNHARCWEMKDYGLPGDDE
jgi:hypothetical protein